MVSATYTWPDTRRHTRFSGHKKEEERYSQQHDSLAYNFSFVFRISSFQSSVSSCSSVSARFVLVDVSILSILFSGRIVAMAIRHLVLRWHLCFNFQLLLKHQVFHIHCDTAEGGG